MNNIVCMFIFIPLYIHLYAFNHISFIFHHTYMQDRVSLGKERLIWIASLTKSEAGHNEAMDAIREASRRCYDRLAVIPVDEEWCLFQITANRSHRLFGISISNGVETEMSRLETLGIGYSSPCQLFLKVIDLWTQIYSQGRINLSN